MDAGSETVGALIGRCLRAAGATRVFGAAATDISGLDGLGHVVVDEPAVAAVLADAAGRTARPVAVDVGPAVGGPAPDPVAGPGVAALPGRRLRLSSAPGEPAVTVEVTEPGQIPTAVAGWSFGAVHGATELVLDLDLEAPAPADLAPLVLGRGPQARAVTLDPALADLRLAVLVGPGVVRAGQVDALRRFADQTGLGVVNTWGAKGVFRWDDPHHHGTAGLQARDFELAGVTGAQVVLAVGIDRVEAPPERWAGAQVLEVEPWQLDGLALRWPRATEVVPLPALYTELSTALGPHYASDSVPLTPPRAAADLGAFRPEGALVAADPGPAGLWVARALPTTELASVVVPSAVGVDTARGFAAAAGVVGALDGRRCFAVTDHVDDLTEAVLAQARHWGAAVVLEVWGDHEPPAGYSPEARTAALAATVAEPSVTVLPVPVDQSLTSLLEAVAGPVVAWD